MGLRKTVEPTAEPVTLAEAKLHCKVEHALDDALITRLIKAARIQWEARTQRTAIETTYVLTLDEFPDSIMLLSANVLDITSVEYRDTAGVLQTLNQNEYTVDTGSLRIGWIYPSGGFAWPVTWDQPNAVVVTYTAGFGTDASKVPDDVKAWILLMVEALYINRSAGVEKVISELPVSFFDALLADYRTVVV